LQGQVQAWQKVMAAYSCCLFSAAEWKLDEPDWTGRLRVIAKGNDVVLKLEDANTGKLVSEYFS